MSSELTRWLRLRWRSLFRPRVKEDELRREVQFHLDQLVAEKMADGMAPAEAREQAIKEFGGMDQYIEEVRDSWRPSFLRDILHDLRYSFRQFRKAPSFTLIVILTVAVGIGASTAIFSIVNSVAFQPLGYANPEQLVEIRQEWPDRRNGVTPLRVTMEELQERAAVFSEVAGYGSLHGNMTGVGIPVRVFGNSVTLNYFSALGVKPMLGRDFLPEEGIEGKSDVIILNHAFWRDHFNADPAVINTTVFINGRPYTIVGVMPEGFRTEPGSPKAFTPLVTNPIVTFQRYLRSVIARLKPGQTVEQAQAELDVLSQSLQATDSELWKDLKLRAVPMLDYQVGDTRPTLFLLLGAVGFLLLIACVNVANLLLARTSSRQREIALRTALGADRRRVIRQLLTESVFLASLGGISGILLAYGTMSVLLSFAPVNLPRVDEIKLDGFALLFSSLLTILTGIGFGLVPALQASKVDLHTALKDGGRTGGGGRRSTRLRNGLVITEIALALTLLIGSGLLLRTFTNLMSTDLGYNGDDLYAERVMHLPDKYPDNDSRIEFALRALDQIATKPEILSAAFSSGLPYYGSRGARLDIESRSNPDADELPFVRVVSVTPDYFRTLGNTLLRGRHFDDHDRQDGQPVAVVTEEFVRRHFPDQDPIGQQVALVENESREWREIVGITNDMKWTGIAPKPASIVFVPYVQYATTGHPQAVVRVRPGAANPGPMVAAAIQAVDDGMPMTHEMSHIKVFDGNSIGTQKFMLFLFSVFSTIALLLAALGIFGVMSYTVSQRTNEFGVRIALGASAGDVFKIVFLHTAKLVTVGLIIGTLSSLALTQLLESVLFGVDPHDLRTIGVMGLGLIFVSALSAYLPARRACRVDPMVALRAE